jgi:phosphatidylethanolamine/phosphatidyl-N-methylethanolamine N-methyltransferase
MTAALRRKATSDARLLFLQGFLRRPKQVGSIVPSSRFLERRVVRCAGVETARTVVELGPGVGGTTRALLRAMAPASRLLAIEIDPRFARLLRIRLHDPRLVVQAGSAAEVSGALVRHGLPAPEVVLSGIPFSTMDRPVALSILRAVHEVLAPGGRFVAYQVRDRVATLGREVFGPARVQTELLNVPPMRVFAFRKDA